MFEQPKPTRVFGLLQGKVRFDDSILVGSRPLSRHRGHNGRVGSQSRRRPAWRHHV